MATCIAVFKPPLSCLLAADCRPLDSRASQQTFSTINSQQLILHLDNVLLGNAPAQKFSFVLEHLMCFLARKRKLAAFLS